jgi:hypothetical protein
MTIVAFDPAKCREVRTDIQLALDAVARKHGLTLDMGGGRYSEQDFRVQVGFRVGVGVKPQSERDFSAMAQLYGLKSTDLGKTFMHKGHTFAVCGLKSSSRRFPILAKRTDGKTYKFPADFVRRALAGEAQPELAAF